MQVMGNFLKPLTPQTREHVVILRDSAGKQQSYNSTSQGVGVGAVLHSGGGIWILPV